MSWVDHSVRPPSQIFVDDSLHECFSLEDRIFYWGEKAGEANKKFWVCIDVMTWFLWFLIFKVAMLKHTCSLALCSRQTCMRNACTRENTLAKGKSWGEILFPSFLSPKVRQQQQSKRILICKEESQKKVCFTARQSKHDIKPPLQKTWFVYP